MLNHESIDVVLVPLGMLVLNYKLITTNNIIIITL